MICEQCETVAHCTKHGCVPKQPAKDSAMRLALEALEAVTKELLAVRDELAERGGRPKANVFHQRLWDSSHTAYTDKAIPAAIALRSALSEQPAPVQEPVAWVPYLSDRADGVQGHYAIARWNPRGYREVWNLRRHAWGAFSDDVMSLEEADYLLQQITIPTRKPTPPAAQQQWVGLTDEEMYLNCPNWLSQEQCKVWVQQIEAKIKEKNNG